MLDLGQTAYEARFADCVIAPPLRLLSWAELSDENREVWRRVERAVLAAGTRIAVVQEAWGREVDISRPATPSLSVPAPILTSGETEKERAAAAPARMIANSTQAITVGYTGSMCAACGSFEMVRSGTCETCQSCFVTSGGCS